MNTRLSRPSILQEVGSVSLKNSGDFLVGKRPHLLKYQDVQDLGMDLAERTDADLRGVEHHFVRLRAELLRTFASKQIFIGSGALDELILGAIQDPATRDVVEAVVARIFDYGIHKPGALVVPLHSFGIAGFGFYRHFRKAAVTVKFPQLGLVLTHQTNSLSATLDFLDSAIRVLKLSGQVPHESIRLKLST